ncbi:MAG: hypothetical protein KBT12_06910 [Bacteroidales bacterium]|nr:hypothetical protein [Candidatus Physcousia equi]
MKKIIFTLLLICCTLNAAAQYDTIKLNFKGTKPTISDFATALVSRSPGDEDFEISESLNAFASDWKRQKAGKRLDGNTTIVVDEKNGYLCYESRYDTHLLRIEMCFWNESDQKHKLFSYNITCFDNNKYSPGQFDGINFYRYDNATRKMTFTHNVGNEFPFCSEDGSEISYALPRIGKDITATTWHKKGKKQKSIRWTGKGFSDR